MSDIHHDDDLPGDDAFKEVRDSDTGEVNPDAIAYTDAQGTVWNFVPRGHRFFDLYERWRAAGHEPLPADPPEAEA